MLKETDQNTEKIKDLIRNTYKLYGQQCSNRVFKLFWDPLYSKLMNFGATSEKFLHRMNNCNNETGNQNSENDLNNHSFVSLRNCLIVAKDILTVNSTLRNEYAPSFSSN